MNIKRILSIEEVLKYKSCFLFGPRQVGKSFLIRQQLAGYQSFDLLEHGTFIRFAQNPGRLGEEIRADSEIVIIDEIQKLPILLDEVHRLIENRGIHFLLTGSSARKLRHGGVNLLGGRARHRHLHPFVFRELESHDFSMRKVMENGSIPSIYFSDAPREDISAYVHDYLQLEIMQEGLVRNLGNFSRFLEVIALTNTQIVNFTNIANDAQVSPSTVRDYFSILKDTLVVHELPAWRKPLKRKAIATSKCYMFDTGIVHFLQGRGAIKERSPEYGEYFEAWIHHELRSYVDYHPPLSLHYWRTTSGFEVDFILGERVAIEVKAKENIANNDLKGIRALMEENICEAFIVVSSEPLERKLADGIRILPWRQFLDELWDGKILC